MHTEQLLFVCPAKQILLQFLLLLFAQSAVYNRAALLISFYSFKKQLIYVFFVLNRLIAA